MYSAKIRHTTSQLTWAIILSFVAGMLFGMIASAFSDSISSTFRVGLRIVSPNSAPLAAPAISLPARATTIAVEGPTSYHVSSMSLAEAGDYFRANMPQGGYQLVNQAGAGDRWESLWRREGDRACVQIEAQTVVGTEVVRLKTTSMTCQ